MPALTRALLALAFAAIPLNAAGLSHPAGTGVHEVHLSYTRMVVDGASVVCRVRLFKDDIEGALQRHTSSPAFRLASAPAADSIFAAYFNAHVIMTSSGRRLSGRVVQSGIDAGVADEPMWWYVVELPAPATVRELSIRIGLLFERFSDQKNVVTVLKMPKEERYSLYFAADDDKEQVLKF